ncbi:putative Ig domain-containing protein [Simiduia aestuariiviva]|uniref:Dystroglycan-type cadherin-like domain-containing protein n=1 Tax=Simiduia aestuariiviva TaxID=1510459 RepID=A0A839USV3_9GAMM|nr:putative Ig domain-containing protein [Simiduia aestuariiviva]MBB3169530.1 hypothetical protein [Simiduia aestuariiviva]
MKNLQPYQLIWSFCMLCFIATSLKAQDTEPPQLVLEPPHYVTANSTYHFTPTLSTPPNGLFFELENGPVWMSLDPGTGTLSGAPTVEDVGGSYDIVLKLTDGMDMQHDLALFYVDVLPLPLSQDNLSADGSIIETNSGYELQGQLDISANGQSHTLLNSDLTVAFDDEGNLIAVEGEAEAPAQLSDNVTLNTAVRSIVGYYTGAELNQMDAINISLKDQVRYFVYMIENQIDLTIDNRDGSGPEQVTLTPPLNGKILIITDMSDPMFYRFASIPFGPEIGHGDSYHGRLPFIPSLGYGKLQSFDGHLVDLGSTSLGFKVFDFFDFSGTWVTKIPTFNEVDLTDPLNSTLTYKMGLNGEANYGLSVFGVGIFSFPFGETSATMHVGFGEDHFAMRNTIAPDTSWLPAHLPFYNNANLTADWFVTDTDYAASISGQFESTIPAAILDGTISLTPDGVTMTATVADDTLSLAVNAEFHDTGYNAEVMIPSALQDHLAGDVNAMLDATFDEIQTALDALTEATSAYEFEVSLRGIRNSIPAVADTAISSLNAMPSAIYNSVYSASLNYMKKKCWSTWIGKRCLYHYINEGSHARTAANRAKATAVAQRDALVPLFQNLKTQALAADSESLRIALATALQTAIDNRTTSVKAYYRIKVLGKYYTVINKTYNRTLISSSNTQKLIDAKSYIPYIAETSDIKVSAQTVVDELPTQQVIEQVRDEIQQGLTAIPTIESLGFSVENGQYSATVQLDGQSYDTDVNLLTVNALRDFLSKKATDQLVDLP